MSDKSPNIFNIILQILVLILIASSLIKLFEKIAYVYVQGCTRYPTIGKVVNWFLAGIVILSSVVGVPWFLYWLLNG